MHKHSGTVLQANEPKLEGFAKRSSRKAVPPEMSVPSLVETLPKASHTPDEHSQPKANSEDDEMEIEVSSSSGLVNFC